MSGSELEERIADLIRGFFRGKLLREPRSVEVRSASNLLLVRVKGFLDQADRMAVQGPADPRTIERSHRRQLAQVAPLIRAGIGTRGHLDLPDFQILLDLPGDTCVFIWTVRQGESAGTGAEIDARTRGVDQ